MDFYGMKRRELQAECKKHNIPANLTNLEMANKLTAFLKEKEKPIKQARTCLKNLTETVEDNDSGLVTRHAKKVRFSPNNETIEYSTLRSGRKEKMRMMQTRSRMRPAAKKGDDPIVENVEIVESLNKNAGNAVRVLRSRAKSPVDDGVIALLDPPMEKKRGKRVAKDINGADSIKEIMVSPVRILRSTVPTSLEIGVIPVVKPMVEKRRVKGVAKNRGGGESVKEVVISPVRMTRSRVQTSEEGVVNKVPNPPVEKKRTRRGMNFIDRSAQLNVLSLDVSAFGTAASEARELPKRRAVRDTKLADDDKYGSETKRLRSASGIIKVSDKNPVATSIGIVQHDKGVRRSLRNREVGDEDKNGVESKRPRGAKGINKVSENKPVATDGGIAQYEDNLRRSKRNAPKVEDYRVLNVNFNKTEKVTRGKMTRSKAQSAVKSSERNGQTRSKSEVDDPKESEVGFQAERPLVHSGDIKQSKSSMHKVQKVSEVVFLLEEPAIHHTGKQNRRKSVMPNIDEMGSDEPVAEKVNTLNEDQVFLQPSVPLRRSQRTAPIIDNMGAPETVGKELPKVKCSGEDKEHVRRFQSASRDESVAISDGANAIVTSAGNNRHKKKRGNPTFEEDASEINCVPLVEESPRRFTRSASKSDISAAAILPGNIAGKRQPQHVAETPGSEVKNCSVNRNLTVEERNRIDAQFSLSEIADSSRKRMNSSRSVHATKQAGSIEVYAKTSNLEEDVGQILSVSAPKSEWFKKIEVSPRRFTRSASKSERNDATNLPEEVDGKKKHLSKSETPKLEVGLPLAKGPVVIDALPSIDAQFSTPVVAEVITDPILSSSKAMKGSSSKKRTTFTSRAKVQGGSKEVYAEASVIEESRRQIFMNSEETSASKSEMLQTDESKKSSITENVVATDKVLGQNASRDESLYETNAKASVVAKSRPRKRSGGPCPEGEPIAIASTSYEKSSRRVTRSAAKTKRNIAADLPQIYTAERKQSKAESPNLEVEVALRDDFSAIEGRPGMNTLLSMPEAEGRPRMDAIFSVPEVAEANSDPLLDRVGVIEESNLRRREDSSRSSAAKLVSFEQLYVETLSSNEAKCQAQVSSVETSSVRLQSEDREKDLDGLARLQTVGSEKEVEIAVGESVVGENADISQGAENRISLPDYIVKINDENSGYDSIKHDSKNLVVQQPVNVAVDTVFSEITSVGDGNSIAKLSDSRTKVKGMEPEQEVLTGTDILPSPPVDVAEDDGIDALTQQIHVERKEMEPEQEPSTAKEIIQSSIVGEYVAEDDGIDALTAQTPIEVKEMGPEQEQSMSKDILQSSIVEEDVPEDDGNDALKEQIFVEVKEMEPDQEPLMTSKDMLDGPFVGEGVAEVDDALKDVTEVDDALKDVTEVEQEPATGKGVLRNPLFGEDVSEDDENDTPREQIPLGVREFRSNKEVLRDTSFEDNLVASSDRFDFKDTESFLESASRYHAHSIKERKNKLEDTGNIVEPAEPHNSSSSPALRNMDFIVSVTKSIPQRSDIKTKLKEMEFEQEPLTSEDMVQSLCMSEPAAEDEGISARKERISVLSEVVNSLAEESLEDLIAEDHFGASNQSKASRGNGRDAAVDIEADSFVDSDGRDRMHSVKGQNNNVEDYKNIVSAEPHRFSSCPGVQIMDFKALVTESTIVTEESQTVDAILSVPEAIENADNTSSIRYENSIEYSVGMRKASDTNSYSERHENSASTRTGDSGLKIAMNLEKTSGLSSVESQSEAAEKPMKLDLTSVSTNSKDELLFHNSEFSETAEHIDEIFDEAIAGAISGCRDLLPVNKSDDVVGLEVLDSKNLLPRKDAAPREGVLGSAEIDEDCQLKECEHALNNNRETSLPGFDETVGKQEIVLVSQAMNAYTVTVNSPERKPNRCSPSFMPITTRETNTVVEYRGSSIKEPIDHGFKENVFIMGVNTHHESNIGEGSRPTSFKEGQTVVDKNSLLPASSTVDDKSYSCQYTPLEDNDNKGTINREVEDYGFNLQESQKTISSEENQHKEYVNKENQLPSTSEDRNYDVKQDQSLFEAPSTRADHCKGGVSYGLATVMAYKPMSVNEKPGNMEDEKSIQGIHEEMMGGNGNVDEQNATSTTCENIFNGVAIDHWQDLVCSDNMPHERGRDEAPLHNFGQEWENEEVLKVENEDVPKGAGFTPSNDSYFSAEHKTHELNIISQIPSSRSNLFLGNTERNEAQKSESGVLRSDGLCEDSNYTMALGASDGLIHEDDISNKTGADTASEDFFYYEYGEDFDANVENYGDIKQDDLLMKVSGNEDGASVEDGAKGNSSCTQAENISNPRIEDEKMLVSDECEKREETSFETNR